MNSQQLFSTPTAHIFLLMFWFTWWFKLCCGIAVTAIAFIMHYVKINRVKNEKADLERQLLERSELLVYSTKNEQKANERLAAEENNKAKLLSRINHEIRTPMNAVLGMASLLKETNLTAEQEGYASTIVRSGESLLKVINDIMVNDILDYSKLESGKELEAKEIDLCNCIEEVLEVFSGRAAKAGIDLLYYVDDNVPSQIVGDLRRLRQILTNLVENAIKVTKRGEVFLGVHLVHCKEDNRIKLEFEVRDTGAGMNGEKTAAISKFLGSQQTSPTSDVSTGAGLIICKKLVKLMGGSMNLESREKQGTTVRFTIYSKAGMQPSRANTAAEAGDLENKRILVVDDNPIACDTLRKRLEHMKMVTSCAGSGAEAMEVLTQVSFDLVLTKVNMAGMTGVELAEQIRSHYPALPVISVVNGDAPTATDNAALFAGELRKPLRRHLLLDAIQRLLRSNQSSTTSKQGAHKLTEEFSKQYPLRILIAEDNPVNQQWTAKILAKLGYSSEVAANGKEVLEMVSTSRFDLILMDVQMPVMDGLEATRMIRLCLDAQPVIMAMTANVMQGDRQDCFQSGMDDYISKPLELNQFVGKLEKWASLIKEKRQFKAKSKA